jgi:DNA-binding transcriptional MerR regulator
MSWETRTNGKRYYTRSRRVGGRIQREYIGGGTIGELAAMYDKIDRETRLQEVEMNRELRRQAKQLDEVLAQFEELADNVGRGILIAAGFHQHNRGEWRKRNEQDSNAIDR